MDPHWESDLDTLTTLLENPPAPGSEDDVCIDTLLERVLRFWREAPATPREKISGRLASLTDHITAIEERRARSLPDWEAWRLGRLVALPL